MRCGGLVKSLEEEAAELVKQEGENVNYEEVTVD